jgi:ParB family chromosome partitioning protein
MIGRAKESADQIRQADAARSPTELLDVDNLVPGPYQARRDFSDLAELTADIRRNGVLQPVLVRPLESGRYELVAGERRWRAAREAGLRDLPAVVRRMTDQEARIFGLVENLRREDLNAYEVAQATVALASAQGNIPQDQLIQEMRHKRPPEEMLRAVDAALEIVGRKITLRTFTRHYLPLLSLPTELVAALEGGAAYVAVAALRRATPEQQNEWLPYITSGEWGARDVATALREARESQSTTAVATHTWTNQVSTLVNRVTPERLAQLDGRQQRKVRRLLSELAEIMK